MSELDKPNLHSELESQHINHCRSNTFSFELRLALWGAETEEIKIKSHLSSNLAVLVAPKIMLTANGKSLHLLAKLL
jgi:hypothetical protein